MKHRIYFSGASAYNTDSGQWHIIIQGIPSTDFFRRHCEEIHKGMVLHLHEMIEDAKAFTPVKPEGPFRSADITCSGTTWYGQRVGDIELLVAAFEEVLGLPVARLRYQSGTRLRQTAIHLRREPPEVEPRSRPLPL